MGGRGGSPGGGSGSSYVMGRNSDEVTLIGVYASLRREDQWVRLSRIRSQLGDLGWDRARQDAALNKLGSRPDANLITIANLKSLTPADRAAALHRGGEDYTALGMQTKATTRQFRAERARRTRQANSPAARASRQAVAEMMQREAREAAEVAQRFAARAAS